MTLEQRVATKIGVWKEGQRCEKVDVLAIASGHGCNRCSYIAVPDRWNRVRIDHDISCPNMHGPEMIVKMIEWLILQSSLLLMKTQQQAQYLVVPGTSVVEGPTLAAALLHAIDALEVPDAK